MKLAKFLCVLLLLAAPFSVFGAAEIELFSAAGVSFPTLAVPLGVRAIGMGDAYTAAGNDVEALNWNPAGLAKISGYQLGLADNEWSTTLGIRQDYISYGQGIGQSSGFGASINYFGLGQLDERDSTGALQGQSSASVFSGSAGYALSMLDQNRLKLGLALEFGLESLFGTSETDIGGDLGLVFDMTHEYSVGLSVNHIGTGTEGFSPPESVSAGFSALLLDRSLTIDVDGEVPVAGDTMLDLGAEYNVSSLSLRAGYREALNAPPGDVQSGFTAGAGFTVGVFSLDYAFVPYGDLSTVNRVQLTMKLPNDFFQPKYIGAAPTSTTAKAYYDKAVGLEKSGDTLKALVLYQTCEENYPDKLKATPQPFYTEAVKKIKDLQAEMSVTGDNGEIAKLTKEYLATAQDDMNGHRYKDAIDQLQQAKKIDQNNPAIEKMLKEARHDFEERLSSYRSAGSAADQDNRLNAAIDNYKKLLAIDPTDPQALAFFTKRRKEIESALKMVHRKGIDQYVGGQVEEAVQTWTAGEALDYWGDIDFKRDIDKAKKLLDLREQK
jgi:hypothetical protein